MADSNDKFSFLYRYRMKKARQFLADAGDLFELGSYSSSANRSYYAVHAACRALLALRGIDTSSHEELHSMMEREYGAPGLVEPRLMGSIGVLRDRRVRADYGDDGMSPGEAGDSLARAGEFVAAAENPGGEKILA